MESLLPTISLDSPSALLLLIPLAILATYLYFRTKATAALLSRCLGSMNKGPGLVDFVVKLLLLLLLVLLASGPYLVFVKRVPVGLDSIDLVEEKGVVHVVLVDVSRSMSYSEGGSTRLHLALTLLSAYLERLGPNDRVALGFFARSVNISAPLRVSEAEALLSSAQAIHRYSALGDAMAAALSYAKTVNAPVVVVLITDGAWNYGANPVDISREYKDSKVPLVVVKVGEDPRGRILSSVADESNGKLFSLDEFSRDVVKDIAEDVRRTARFAALKAKGEAYLEVKYKDYSPVTLITLAALALLLYSIRDGV